MPYPLFHTSGQVAPRLSAAPASGCHEATLSAGPVRLTVDLEAGGLCRIVVAVGEAVPLVVVFALVGAVGGGLPRTLRGYLLIRGVEQHFDIPVVGASVLDGPLQQPLAEAP